MKIIDLVLKFRWDLFLSAELTCNTGLVLNVRQNIT